MFTGSDGKIGITQTQEEWETGGFATSGAHLASLDPHEQRRRNRYTLRRWYEDELQAIWAAQAPHYPGVLTDELHQKLADPATGIVFYQHPLSSLGSVC